MPETAHNVALMCTVSELGDEARALCRDGMAPREFLNILMEKNHFPDAVRFLAHAMPKREAVWWAWMCARRSAGDEPEPSVKASLDATERWIKQPTEENRRAAMQAAEKADLKTAAGCAGLAAFFSAGSLAPPHAAVVEPGEFLAAKAVTGAVIFAAVGVEPEKSAEKFRAYVDQAVGVVNRIKLWGKES